MNLSLLVLRWTLKRIARLLIWKYRPGIVGVTGSVGKTSAKFAIASVLSVGRRVRVAQANFNNELGLPLTIIGSWDKTGGIFFWLGVVWEGLRQLVIKVNYPEILVLEYGADKPGDIKYLLEIARPNMSVITAIGEVPVHVEFYENVEAVIKEKGGLIDYLPSAGLAALNYDDPSVMKIKDRTRSHVITFGFNRGADVYLSNFEHIIHDDLPQGISFKLQYGGEGVVVRIPHTLGRTQAYAAGAAATIGFMFGMTITKIAEGLKDYQSAHSRMELVPGIKSSYVIDDSYNASPLSMRAALETLRDLPAKRRIAILGDMRELGKYSVQAHQDIGRLVPECADILITVGLSAKFIAESARALKMKKGSVMSFDSSEEVHPEITKILKKGDLVLVKGSRGVHLERVVEEIKAI